MTDSGTFWEALETLISGHPIVIDRPAGTSPLDYPEMIYPVDYGYLDGTTSIDGSGVDIFVGNTGLARVDGALVTVDLGKRDAEVKILYACSPDDMQTLHAMLNGGAMSALLVRR